MLNNILLSAVLLTVLCFPFYSFANVSPPDIMLALPYHSKLMLKHYSYAEKYDGVRGYWNGRAMRTRSGRLITVPKWFLKGMPQYELEGELWLGRGTFDQLSGLLRRKELDDLQWRNVVFKVFDSSPSSGRAFSSRYQTLQDQSAMWPSWLQLVTFEPIPSENWLKEKLGQLTSEGGEGIILKRMDGYYIKGRSENYIKLKIMNDAEAVVIGYNPGKGKYLGVVGSLRLQKHDGTQFSVGSGLTDEVRAKPPEIGSIVSYRFSGVTLKGKPRFARFLRLRDGVLD